MEQGNLDVTKKGLTAVLLERLLQRLDPNRDRAGERYENLRRRLVKFFQWNNCFPEEDLADETLDRVAQKIASVEIRDVGAFLWGVAKNVARESARKPPTTSLDDLHPAMEPHTGNAELLIIDKEEKKRRLECLHQCIQKLAPEDRELFLAYQYYTWKRENPQALADRFQLTLSALRSKAHRLKVKMENCTLKCFCLKGVLKLPVVEKEKRANDS